VEVYRSGAGKSGGQRQKLATTCLAAALRYQLGGADHGAPVYAPGSAGRGLRQGRQRITALAMNIFANFGFQMIVATPAQVGDDAELHPFSYGRPRSCFLIHIDAKAHAHTTENTCA